MHAAIDFLATAHRLTLRWSIAPHLGVLRRCALAWWAASGVRSQRSHLLWPLWHGQGTRLSARHVAALPAPACRRCQGYGASLPAGRVADSTQCVPGEVVWSPLSGPHSPHVPGLPHSPSRLLRLCLPTPDPVRVCVTSYPVR